MADKSWMLNAKAISAAKKCIGLVEQELGIKLKLSNPDFLELLADYAELNESPELIKAVTVLAQYAPANVQKLLVDSTSSNIVKLSTKTAVAHQASASVAPSEPMVDYNGKRYARYNEGKEFAGLYRGQPRYV